MRCRGIAAWFGDACIESVTLYETCKPPLAAEGVNQTCSAVGDDMIRADARARAANLLPAHAHALDVGMVRILSMRREPNPHRHAFFALQNRHQDVVPARISNLHS